MSKDKNDTVPTRTFIHLGRKRRKNFEIYVIILKTDMNCCGKKRNKITAFMVRRIVGRNGNGKASWRVERI